MFRSIPAVLLSVLGAGVCFGQSDRPLLLRNPTVSRSQIAFSYAGDIWIVGREGGEARRLTVGPGAETRPIFSPDGTTIAFTGEYDGNQDVYLVPAAGGVPRRLTYHPGRDEAVGWTPDGRKVLFNSPRDSYSDFPRLFTVPVEGGFPSAVPLPMAEEGSFSSDGSQIAYVPTIQWQRAWKRYRGGQTKPIWIANLNDSTVVAKIPRDNSNDFSPMWVGDTIYFLSDRKGPVALFAYDTKSKEVRQVVQNGGLDFKSASAGPGVIAYEQFGSVHLLDVENGRDETVKIRVAGDLTDVRPHFLKIEPNRIRSAGISPTGARAVFGARGEILTVPAEKGDIRDLTKTTGIMERDPAWSPDGQSIAYFSDESGEYALHIRNQSGSGEVRKIDLGSPPTFYYSPVWSPDSKKIAYSDKRLNIWYIDLEKKTPVRIDTDTYTDPAQGPTLSWSPDSRWLAYTKQLVSHLHAVFIYSLEQAKSSQVTDGMSDALYPQFDKEGKSLYFTASTDVALSQGWLDMSSLNRPATRSVYVVVLKKDLPSPLAPESDEEKPPASRDEGAKTEDKDKDKAKEAKPVTVQIDFDNLGQRILALPIPPKNYTAIAAGKTGVLFVVEGPGVINPVDFDGGGPSLTVHKFDLKTRKTEKILDGVQSFDLAFNGERMLYRQKQQWIIAPAQKPGEGPPKPGEGGPLKLDSMQVFVDPRAEWRHMYDQVWRGERDFFYDPGLHGLQLAEVKKRYEPFLEGIANREDLNYLFEEMLGEMTVGHMFVGGGDRPEVKKVKGGLLGADYTIENGRYRFARVYNGENWNPKLRAPLTQPGVNVVAGEYLLAVNGRDLRATDEIYSYFEETADKQVVLRVGPNPEGSGARDVTVVPVEDESGLRNLAWIEGNRRKVDQMTGGRVAYVYLPDTYAGGYTNFNRYYFAQVGKEAAIIDERFNGGGDIADYIIDYLRRPLLNYFTMREGKDITTPTGGFTGTPDLAFYSPDGTWDVENHGVPPDVEVEMDPKLVREGHDPQLERAVEVVMELLKKNPPPTTKRPPYPNYHKQEQSVGTVR
jgi:tricorn protease